MRLIVGRNSFPSMILLEFQQLIVVHLFFIVIDQLSINDPPKLIKGSFLGFGTEPHPQPCSIVVYLFITGINNPIEIFLEGMNKRGCLNMHLEANHAPPMP